MTVTSTIISAPTRFYETPPKKRDHPLNAAIVVVFSKPVDGSTTTPATIRLLQGTTAVPGSVRFLDPTLDATHALGDARIRA